MPTNVEADPGLLKLSRQHALDIDQSSGRRRSVPIRSVFSRDLTGNAEAPMAQLVRVGGRGGVILLKLYIALIWRSSAAPFDSALPARKWAELLALPDPAHGGARRVTDAIKTLERHRLISVEPRPGEPSRITLLHESGTGAPYDLPRGGAGDHYFQIPAKMWLNGDLQRLSAPGLAMLIAVLTDQSHPGATVWWSTTRFPGRFGLSPATRSRGTKELVDAGLLTVHRRSISTTGRSFATERVRKIYAVTGSALLPEIKPAKTKANPSMAKGDHRSAVTGKFVKASTAARNSKTTVTERGANHSSGTHRNAITGKFVKGSTAARHPKTTVTERG